MNCNCGEAKLLETKKPGPNQGRKFFTCAKPQGSQCDFFCWEGETPRAIKSRAPRTDNGIQSQALTNITLRLDKMAEFLKGMDENIKELLSNQVKN